MRILHLLAIAAPLWASSYLPQVAQKIPTPGCRIKLEWISSPAGSIAPPQAVAATLDLAEGNRFRFRSSQVVATSDGTTLRQWNASTNQLILRRASQLDAANLPSGLLQAALAGTEKSSSLERLDGKAARRLDLDVSKPPLSKYAKATLWARDPDFQPLRLEVEAPDGSKTVWKILSLSRWKPSASDFEYSPPKGAEVVDMR
jgi:outer membrane lipoprotein-sorting protein